MDVTERPVKIPQDLSVYAEKYQLYETFQILLTELLVVMPAEPLPYMIEFFRNLRNVPKIIIIGPPFAGKTLITDMLIEKFKCNKIDKVLVFGDRDADIIKMETKEWLEAVEKELKSKKSLKTGWILDGVVETREQALALSHDGFFPKHTVIIDVAPDVLKSRIEASFIIDDNDERPANEIVIENLNKEKRYKEIFKLFCHNKNLLMDAYKASAKCFDGDRPIEELFNSIFLYVCEQKKTRAPFTPRVIVLGPPGSGVERVASIISEKHRINLFSYKKLMKDESAKEGKLGEIFRLCQETCIEEPDEAKFDLIYKHLVDIKNQFMGWLVYGYPDNINQAEYLTAQNYHPNRVFFMEISDEKIKEKLTSDEGIPEFYNESHQKLNFFILKYRNNEKRLKEFYKDVGFSVDAEGSLEKMVDTVESLLFTPISMCKELFGI